MKTGGFITCTVRGISQCSLTFSFTEQHPMLIWEGSAASQRQWLFNSMGSHRGSVSAAVWALYGESLCLFEGIGCGEQGDSLVEEAEAEGGAVGATRHLLTTSSTEQHVSLFFRSSFPKLGMNALSSSSWLGLPNTTPFSLTSTSSKSH